MAASNVYKISNFIVVKPTKEYSFIKRDAELQVTAHFQFQVIEQPDHPRMAYNYRSITAILGSADTVKDIDVIAVYEPTGTMAFGTHTENVIIITGEFKNKITINFQSNSLPDMSNWVELETIIGIKGLTFTGWLPANRIWRAYPDTLWAVSPDHPIAHHIQDLMDNGVPVDNVEDADQAGQGNKEDADQAGHAIQQDVKEVVAPKEEDDRKEEDDKQEEENPEGETEKPKEAWEEYDGTEDGRF